MPHTHTHTQTETDRHLKMPTRLLNARPETPQMAAKAWRCAATMGTAACAMLAQLARPPANSPYTGKRSECKS